MKSRLNWKQVEAQLDAETVLPEWLPNGQWENKNRYICGSIRGNAGKTLNVFRTNTGWGWKDNNPADGHKGRGLISLYAAIHGISLDAAMEKLETSDGDAGGGAFMKAAGKAEAALRRKASGQPDLVAGTQTHLALKKPYAPRDWNRPPKDAGANHCRSTTLGTPSDLYRYHDEHGSRLFYVARYYVPKKDKEGNLVLDADGKQVMEKETRPWSWCTVTRDDGNERTGWHSRAYSTKKHDKPLYNLREVYESAQEDNPPPVLIVAGEKCVDAARKILGERPIVTTYAGGEGNWTGTDFSPLAGRTIYMWPDADEAGAKSFDELAQYLWSIGAGEVRMIDVSGMPEKWDIADAILGEKLGPGGTKLGRTETPWTRTQVIEFIKERRKKVEPAPVNTSGSTRVKKGDRPAEFSEGWKQKLQLTKTGVPYSSFNNACIALEGEDIISVLGYNQLIDYAEVIVEPNHWKLPKGPWTDDMTAIMTRHIQGLDIQVKDYDVDKAVRLVSRQNKFHPVRNYIKSLKWDGKPRLATWIIDYLHAMVHDGNRAFVEAVSVKFMISAIARIMNDNPLGVQVDTMLVLEGGQGIRKSTTFKALFDPWFLAEMPDIRSKDAKQALLGIWGAEFSEMSNFIKRNAEIERIKSFLTLQVDDFRHPYGRHFSRHARSCVFVGTVNKDTYLTDDQNRRIWPVRLADDGVEIDLEAIKAVRDKLWAEAYYRYMQGEKWYFEKGADDHIIRQAVIEQNARRTEHAWEAPIAEWLSTMENYYVKPEHIFDGVLQIPLKDRGGPGNPHNTVVSILKKLGWVSCKPRVNGMSRTWYVKNGNQDIAKPLPTDYLGSTNPGALVIDEAKLKLKVIR